MCLICLMKAMYLVVSELLMNGAHLLMDVRDVSTCESKAQNLVKRTSKQPIRMVF